MLVGDCGAGNRAVPPRARLSSSVEATEASKHKGKILFVVNEGYFFYSHRIALAESALKSGFDIHIAAPDDHVWAAPGFSNQEFETRGFFYHRIPLSRRGLNPFREVATFLKLIALFRRVRPDIVHLITIKPILYGGIAARISRVPAAVFAVTGLGHVFTARDRRTRVIRTLVTILYRVALGHPRSVVIVQNSHDGEALARAGVGLPGQFHLVPGSGVDLEAFVPRPESGGAPIVVLPARLIWEKGVKEFVEAAEISGRRGIDCRWVLVGDTQPSNPRSVPERQIREWVASGIVEWWGRRDDIADVMASARVVCQPSKYGEGIPKALLEAAASGRAIVASDIPGCNDFVENGVNGLLVPSGDPEAIVAAVHRVIVEPGLGRRMGLAARSTVENKYGLESIVDQTVSLYGQLLSESPR